MKIYIPVFILIFITACTEKKNEFVQPMEGFSHTSIFVTDKPIEGYISYTNDSIKFQKRDSIVYNKLKNTFERITLGWGRSHITWKYDSLNQLVYYDYSSDTYETNYIEYRYFPQLKLIKQLWGDKTHYFYFDNDLKKVLKEVIVNEYAKDTSYVSDHFYIDGLLTKSLHKTRNRFGEMEYTDSTLYDYIKSKKKTQKYYKNGQLITENYYSLKTGLIDSSRNNFNEITSYYKHFSK